jgi:hypothetical protein
LFSSPKKVGVDQAEGVVRTWLGFPKKNPALAAAASKDPAE